MSLYGIQKEDSVAILKLKLNYAVSALQSIKRYRKYPKMVAAETLKIISEIGKEKDNERIFKRLGA